jgi:hypothetical protein
MELLKNLLRKWKKNLKWYSFPSKLKPNFN